MCRGEVCFELREAAALGISRRSTMDLEKHAKESLMSFGHSDHWVMEWFGLEWIVLHVI